MSLGYARHSIAQDRQAIRAAAEALFLRDGYTQTTIRAIAEQAHVSEKATYLAYAIKANLLREIIQVAVHGDEAPETLSERAQWRAVMASTPDEVFARLAALNAALMARTAPIIALAESAAAVDPELAELRARARRSPRPRSRTPAAWPAHLRRQRARRCRHHVRNHERRKRVPPPHQRMRLEQGALCRPHGTQPRCQRRRPIATFTTGRLTP